MFAVINGAIDDVRDATAIVLGAYRVDLAFSNVTDHDRILLSLSNADGKPFDAQVIYSLTSQLNSCKQRR